MTSLEIKENNKMIAHFMGYEYIPFNEDRIMSPGWWLKGVTAQQQAMTKLNNSYLCRSNNDLRYYNEWKWLMPVVTKVTLMCKEHIYEEKWEEQWKKFYDYQSYNFFIGNIKNIYEACVDFINWYNEIEN
jgi:hypothetical protein